MTDSWKSVAVGAAAISVAFLSSGAGAAANEVQSAAAPLPSTDRLAIRSVADARRRRQAVQRYIWGPRGLPLAKQPAVTRGIRDPHFDALQNLERIDRLDIVMPLGFTSVVYHLLPRRANGHLLLYHNGHTQPLEAGRPTVAYFLARGYAVLVLAMPLAGVNAHPAVLTTPCGTVVLASLVLHEGMACLPRALTYFLEPVTVSLNYAKRFRSRSTNMVGLSGGGWTTVVYSALDARIRRSYPVAGTQPASVLTAACETSPFGSPLCFGDFEQRDVGLYLTASYLELYTLGAWGKGRRQLAIYNVYDPCCFKGTSFRRWKIPVQRAVRRLGSGRFEARGDASHREHKISDRARSWILADLRKS